jgi:alkanesulfonate monooxygenase SsuD/methylene tetrahydromethanopterin reductase-like flavin-dependent oxidoreductase (luciferase family)
MNPEVGVALPVRELAILRPRDSAPGLIALARQVEELGFDSVWVGDSFVNRPRLEPLTLLAAISMVTERLTVGTAALTAVLREPKTLAHMVTSLDQLSAGRLVLGLAMGEPLPVNNEADAVTLTYSERIGRVDEVVRAFKIVWEGRDDDLVGSRFDLSELREQGPPLTPGGPGIWLAGNGGPKAVVRAGTWYDGWMPVKITPEQYGQALGRIRDVARAAGRDAEGITPSLYVNVFLDPDAETATAALDEYTTRYYRLPVTTMRNYQAFVGGPPEHVVETLRGYVEAGCRHLIVRLATFTDYDRQLKLLGEQVVPALHDLEIGRPATTP